jgi:hypothetical protein
MFTNVGSMGRFRKIKSYPKDILDGLVSRYTFDESSGVLVSDSVGFDDGTAIGGMTREASKVGSFSGGFDGIDDYVDVGNSNLLSFTENGSDLPFSISSWVKLANNTSQGAIISRWNAAVVDARQWILYPNSKAGGSIELLFVDEAGAAESMSKWTVGGVLSVNTWHHLTVTYNGNASSSGINFYVDGVLQAVGGTTDVPGYVTMTPNSQDVYIGKWRNVGPTDVFFAGQLDDLRVYNRALTPTEVQKLYDLYK